MKTVNSQLHGAIRVLSIKEFLPELLVLDVVGSQKEYNARILNGVFNVEENTEESSYERRLAILDTVPLEQKFARSVSGGTSLKNLFMKNLTELTEDVVTQHLTEFGIDTALVRLSPRTYLVTNPEDIRVFKDGNLTAVVNLAPASNFIVTVDKMLQSEFDARVARITVSVQKRLDAATTVQSDEEE